MDPVERETSPAGALAFGTVALGVLGVVALIVALFVGAGDSDGGTTVTVTGTKTVEVALAEFSVTPATVDVPAGTDLTLHVVNKARWRTIWPSVGERRRFRCCRRSGRRPSRRRGRRSHAGVVHRPRPQRGGHGAGHHGLRRHGVAASPDMNMTTGGTTAGATSNDATIDANAKPGPDWKPFDPTLAPAPGGPTTR